jgi:hypothetical protein
MERLVADLLRLARLDAGQELLDIAPCDLPQMFRAVVADLAQPIAAKGQLIDISVSPDACAINADPAKLHDVMRNLVENAVNYSPDNAEVHIEATRREGQVEITCPIRAPAFLQATSRGCSNASTASTRRDRGQAAWGSASPSSATSSSSMVDTPWQRIGRRAGHASPSHCQGPDAHADGVDA